MTQQDSKQKFPAAAEARPARRRFLGAATAAGTAAIGFPFIARAQTVTNWRFQSTWPTKDIFHEYATDFAKKVNDMTGGDLKIEVLPAGAVVPAFGLIDAVSKGTLDGGHGVLVYHYGKQNALALWGSGPAFGISLLRSDYPALSSTSYPWDHVVEPFVATTLSVSGTLTDAQRGDDDCTWVIETPAGTAVTVNGMSQGVSALPRDLAVTTTVLTSPWDATRGAFSGALVSHAIQSGGAIQRRRGRGRRAGPLPATAAAPATNKPSTVKWSGDSPVRRRDSPTGRTYRSISDLNRPSNIGSILLNVAYLVVAALSGLSSTRHSTISPSTASTNTKPR